MTSRVKKLLLAEGITVTPSANTMSECGSFIAFVDDAAYVTAKDSAAANGDSYYNTTLHTVRLYADGAWGAMAGGSGISTVYMDHTDDGGNLADGFRFIVDMSSASASIDLNAPAGATGLYFEVVTTGIEEQTLYPATVYSVDVLKDGSDSFRLDGTEYTTGITIGTNSDHVSFAWDTGSPWWVTSALTTFVARDLSGTWDIDALRFPSDGTSELDYYAETTVELDSDFTGGELTLNLVRVGKQVTISAVGNPTHSSATTSTTSSGLIPAGFRPSASQSNVYNISGTYLLKVFVTSAGQLETAYYDYAGSALARTESGQFNLSYCIDV